MKVAVTSRSFSKNSLLRLELLKLYPDSYFNEKGLNFTQNELIEFLKSASAAIVGLEKINEEILNQLPHLEIISKYGVGIDNIEFAALKKNQVLWSYTPGTNRRGVAELALQMMLTLIRKSYQCNHSLQKNEWSPQSGSNLSGKKVGILGLGNVGKELVKLLAPFECQIFCHDVKADLFFIKENSLKLISAEELFSSCDIVTIHIPLNKNNHTFIGRHLLDLLPLHAILINTARGGLVDEAILFEKLKNHKIQAAGFDVFVDEPCRHKELLSLDNFYGTPHIGGSSLESVLAMGLAAISGLAHAKDINLDDFVD